MFKLAAVCLSLFSAVPASILIIGLAELKREQGVFTAAAKYRLAQSDEALLRICRLCVSIKLHTQGMSVDDATKFFEENCYYENKKDFQAQEGAAYSLRPFNDAVTGHGQPPVRFLRGILLKDPAQANAIL